jgi:carbamoyl-phosphate synthase small subunit
MKTIKNRKLVLANGMVFEGVGFGSQKEVIAEIVFNTSMVGYQEILSDSSYCGQIVCMTYPLIGNYGITDDDYESKSIKMSGFVVREYNDFPSNFRATKTLGDVMDENDAAGISNIDTRELARVIRDQGSQLVMICDIDKPLDECLKEIKARGFEHNQLERVSTKKVWYSRTANPLYTVVAIDCGIKMNIVRKFNQFGCNVVVVPYTSTYEDIMKYQPDGLFISNGPGDPEDAKEVIELVRRAKGKLPIFGICLGHQIIGLAYGAKTYKMKFGHRGANHPVKNLLNGKIEITSQNHSFAIDKKSLEGTGLELTHVNVIDGELEGVRDTKNHVMSIQYHPESAAGPEDSEYLFKQFIDLLHDFGGNQNA